MTREAIVALFDRRLAAINQHDVAALASLHSEGCVIESPMSGMVQGREGIGKVYQTWMTAFPDLAGTQDDLVIDGDRVVQLTTLVGTDTGGFMGLAPSNKKFRIPLVILCTVADGQIVQEQRVYDFTGMLVQIGVLKARPG
jgi:steroid delta-isomerase-like uncharacterized protein